MIRSMTIAVEETNVILKLSGLNSFFSLFLPLKFKPLYTGPLDVIPATQTPRVQTR